MLPITNTIIAIARDAAFVPYEKVLHLFPKPAQLWAGIFSASRLAEL